MHRQGARRAAAAAPRRRCASEAVRKGRPAICHLRILLATKRDPLRFVDKNVRNLKFFRFD
jgi:hypothetical protein